jgi:hypothetical protein
MSLSVRRPRGSVYNNKPLEAERDSSYDFHVQLLCNDRAKVQGQISSIVYGQRLI